MKPFISICIPAYKNAAYLEILLRSVASQSFRDYEVIVCDDSPDDSVEMLCKNYGSNFPLNYRRNSPAKGSPANWNATITMAKGSWIKMMHDDDWFASDLSLEIFAKAAVNNQDKGFIFSGYSEWEKGVTRKISIPAGNIENKLSNAPLSLIVNNVIGHPSTTLIQNINPGLYDENMKWLVDIDYYIRCLQRNSIYVIRQSLINIGISDQQITKSTFRKREVEIPENLYLLNKMGTGILKNIAVYDHYWRTFRNLGTRNIAEVEQYAAGNIIPEEIRKMLKIQSNLSLSLLRIGAISKLLMAISYIRT